MKISTKNNLSDPTNYTTFFTIARIMKLPLYTYEKISFSPFASKYPNDIWIWWACYVFLSSQNSFHILASKHTSPERRWSCFDDKQLKLLLVIFHEINFNTYFILITRDNKLKYCTISEASTSNEIPYKCGKYL